MNEFCFNALRKLKLEATEIIALCETFDRLEIVPFATDQAREAVRIQRESRINYWDALLVAAARAAGCRTLYTEDLNPGQTIAGVRIVDPFA